MAAGLGQGRGRPVPTTALAMVGVSLAATAVVAVDIGATVVSSIGLAALVGVTVLTWDRSEASDAVPLTTGLVAGAVAGAALCAYQLLLAGNPRATGPFWHANVLGAAAAVTTVGLCSVALRVRSRGRVAFYLLGALASAGMILMSMSRGALLATAVGLVILALFPVPSLSTLCKAPRQRIRVATLFVAALGLLAFAYPLVARRLELADTTIDDSRRDLIWQVTFELAAERPLLGNGFGVWSRLVSEHEPAINTFATTHAHSLYLQLLFDVGTVGTAALVGAALSCIFLALRARPHLWAPVTSVVTASAVSSVAEPLAYWWQYDLVLLIALLAACYQPRSSGTGPPRPSER